MLPGPHLLPPSTGRSDQRHAPSRGGRQRLGHAVGTGRRREAGLGCGGVSGGPRARPAPPCPLHPLISGQPGPFSSLGCPWAPVFPRPGAPQLVPRGAQPAPLRSGFQCIAYPLSGPPSAGLESARASASLPTGDPEVAWTPDAPCGQGDAPGGLPGECSQRGRGGQRVGDGRCPSTWHGAGRQDVPGRRSPVAVPWVRRQAGAATPGAQAPWPGSSACRPDGRGGVSRARPQRHPADGASRVPGPAVGAPGLTCQAAAGSVGRDRAWRRPEGSLDRTRWPLRGSPPEAHLPPEDVSLTRGDGDQAPGLRRGIACCPGAGPARPWGCPGCQHPARSGSASGCCLAVGKLLGAEGTHLCFCETAGRRRVCVLSRPGSSPDLIPGTKLVDFYSNGFCVQSLNLS